MARAGIETIIYIPRSIKQSPVVKVRAALPLPLRWLPWRLVKGLGQAYLDRKFRSALRKSPPNETIAYFWPMPPADLVEYCKTLGIVSIREMINSPCVYSRKILDDAYRARDLPTTHNVSHELAAAEAAELPLYDFVFASNDEVENALDEVGITPERILATTFGWDPKRVNTDSSSQLEDRKLRYVFLGTLNVRKGVLDLLEAFSLIDGEGELVLAGAIDPSIEELIRPFLQNPRIRHLGYVQDVGALLRSADVFVFPTFEEGGPQVTYEAAGCGLPIITTPMGAARLVKTGVNGLVVPAGDVIALKEALEMLAQDHEMRASFGQQAKIDADAFRYSEVGWERSKLVKRAFAEFHAKRSRNDGNSTTIPSLAQAE